MSANVSKALEPNPLHRFGFTGVQAGSQTVSWQSEVVATNNINVFDAEAVPDLLAQPSQRGVEDRSNPANLAIPQPFEDFSPSGFAEGLLAPEATDSAVANSPLETAPQPLKR